MTTLEFYFDYRSPYSYLAHSQLAGMGAEVRHFPFEIRDLMAKVGNVPTSLTCAAKNRYIMADLTRWAAYYGVPFARHPQIRDIDGKRLLRATLAAESLQAAPAAVEAIFQALWGQPAPLRTPAEIATVLAGAGLDPAALEPMMDDPDLEAELEARTAAAVARGVFGAPTLFIGEDMYFGNDRLHFVQDHLARAA